MPPAAELPDEEPEGPNTRALLAAAGGLAVLVLLGLWLTGVIGASGAIQDCVASGRTNCAPIDTHSR